MDNKARTFEPAGSLEPPGTIGRVVRLLLGVICIDLVVQIVDDIPGMIARGWPLNPLSICAIFLGFYLLKPVVNIGFTTRLKYLPQIIVAAISVVLVLVQWLSSQPLFGPTFTVFLMLWMSYVFVHLGLSFVIAAAIKTPGCEMRSIPHLWSKLSGQPSLEHYCPGPLTPIDNWEQKLKIKRKK
jgi:hypothetical protein